MTDSKAYRQGVTAMVSIASYNLHGGIDAWGRPFDAVESVRALGADVIMLQECWTPAGQPGIAAEIAAAIGGTSHQVDLASGRRALPHPKAPAAWQRRRSFVDGDHSLYLDSEMPMRASTRASTRYAMAEPGAWGLAIVSKLPIRSTSVVPLGRLRRDRATRAILVAHLDLDGTPMTAVAVHMTHLTYGSPRHFARLRRELRGLGGPTSATVVGGDMNLWGPLVTAQLPGWHRAVTGRTWPSWGPHSQLDHLLVGRGFRVIGSRVGEDQSSDHLPVIARLQLR